MKCTGVIFSQKLLLMMLSFSIFTSVAAGQAPNENSQPEKCFPSGSSLIAARMSNDGAYVMVCNINQLSKVFDTRTLQVVQAGKTGSGKLQQYFQDVPEEQRYILSSEKLNSNTYPPQLFRIKDLKGAVVAEYESKGAERHSFDKVSGVMIISDQKKVYLLRPGKKVARVAKEDETWRFNASVTFSPDHRYGVSVTGDVVDVEEETVMRYVFKSTTSKEQIIRFNNTSTEFTTGIHGEGLVTYSLQTGKELRRIPIPADLPRIDGFEVWAAPNGREFLYWLNYYSKLASGGLAYWVKDGKGTSFCDPLWAQEQSANFSEMLNAAVKRREEEEAARKAAAKAPTTTNYGGIEHSDADMSSFQNSNSSATSNNTKPASEPRMVTCGKCYGKGSTTITGTGYRQVSSATYQTHSSGYATQVSPARSTTTTTTTTLQCPVCGGSGKVRAR